MSMLNNAGGIRKQLGTTPSPKLALGFQSDTWASGHAERVYEIKLTSSPSSAAHLHAACKKI